MKLYDFERGTIGDLPTPPEIGILNHRIIGKPAQFLFLNNAVGKMAGFILGSRTTSWLLYASRLSKAINAQVDQTYTEFGYRILNDAFIHRYDNAIYPLGIDETESGQFITSPVSAYLSIRDIRSGVAEFFPGVNISVAKMLGSEDERFASGKLFIFTLKPHHDHTIDFPTDSAVRFGPSEINRGRLRVDSTDLAFIRKSARQSVMDENHRVATILHSVPFDEEYAMVEVGANIVNSIEQDYDGSESVHPRGAQKAHFNFGSTVILAFREGLMSKARILEDIYMHSSQVDSACEIKRGTAIMYGKSVKNGTYSVSGTVSLQIADDGNRVTETRVKRSVRGLQ